MSKYYSHISSINKHVFIKVSSSQISILVSYQVKGLSHSKLKIFGKTFTL